MRYFLSVFTFFIFMQNAFFAQPQIQHIEPMNWWVGMKNPALQIMVHGKNIADFTPIISYKGVKITETHKVDNPNYLFIDVWISPKTKAGKLSIVFKNVKNEQFTVEYDLLNRMGDGTEKQSFDASDVVYMLMPDRFANGNSENDNVEGFGDKVDRNGKSTRHGGDIAGIIQHLDYIEKLGFTALWVNPLLENKQPRTSYHGYAITDFYKQDARFGTNSDYVQLSKECKKKGLKLIMDMVLNHCGSKHWWMVDLPCKDWLNFQEKMEFTNHRRESLHDPYASDYDKKMHQNGWFDTAMPDLNQRNPFMAKYLIQNTIWWIETADLGGIRMDTYCYPDKEFMNTWSKTVMTEYPNFNVVGEEWSYNPAIVANWQMGKHNPNISHLKSVMDFPLNAALVEALNTDEKVWNEGFTKLYQALANDFQYPNPNNLMVFGDNHDMSRFYTQLKENYNNFQMGMAYLLTTRGIPQIFYGTEILMTNPKSDAHDEIRSEFPGGFGGDKNAFTGQNLSTKEKEAQQFLQNLLQWRKQTPLIHKGKLKHFAPENGIYVLFRYDEKQKIMLILNKNKTATKLDLAKFKEIIPSSFKAKDVIHNQQIEVKDSINLIPNEPLILEIL